MSARHLASFALIGVTGRRHGTRYIFKFEDISKVMGKPYFRFRNAECEQAWRDWTTLYWKIGDEV